MGRGTSIPAARCVGLELAHPLFCLRTVIIASGFSNIGDIESGIENTAILIDRHLAGSMCAAFDPMYIANIEAWCSYRCCWTTAF